MGVRMRRRPSAARVALLVPPRRDREYAMYRSFLVSFKSDLSALAAAEGLVDRSGDLLWEAGLLNMRVPALGVDVVRQVERELSGKKDIPVAFWPTEYAETLYWTRRLIALVLERWLGEVGVRLRAWADELRRGVTSPDFDSALRYYEGVPARDVQVLRSLPDLAERIVSSVEILLGRMARASDSSFSDAVPASAKARDVEVLYHASVVAKDLARSGFSLAMPSESSSAGLGGSQSAGGGVRGISFTEDQYVAKEIARVFKEVALIARGEVTWSTVLDWVSRGGRQQRVVEWYVHNYGPLPVGEARRDPVQVMGLYLSYLALSDRYDPKFFGVGGPAGLVRRFQKLDPRGIGYIVARVDMSNPNITYGRGEREVRVPPEAILSVDKFIG